MSDAIVSCTKYTDADGELKYYTVLFSFDGIVVPLAWASVSILKEDLSDPTDLEEVKTLACQRIVPIKDLFRYTTEITDINGPVDI